MELATVVQERLKVIYVLLQNHGFASIGALSESHGSQRFGTRYTMGGGAAHNEPGEYIPVDIAKNAQSWGLDVLCVSTMDEFREAFRKAKASDRATMIHIETDLYGPNPPSSSWWDVAVAEVSRLDSTQQARKEYEKKKAIQRLYL